ncbi:MAG TPA: phosphoribosylaminoimidazolesuccinocarboxamide synthase [Actinomycetes bacterium]|jgi:phosphoribosylaminoimidazole-succinocarboxamide synthase|nr:phosphoribosylaminoimidazolesuccinocarboxamide synthase [Actinomycetes bacterium]
MTAAVPLDGLTPIHTGKVRDLYAVGDDEVLIVASDRISAFDRVLETPIPDKGTILTQLSLWWYGQLAPIVPNHLVTAEVDDYPPDLRKLGSALRGRSMLCQRVEMIPIEAVARGYLSGSAWSEYQRDCAVCGIPLPAGLVEGAQLPEPIFTPATKAPAGEHDRNIDYPELVERVGPETAQELRDLTLAVYQHAREITAKHQILLADTKLEFGLLDNGTLMLADEVLTPDSSRFWPADEWEPGGPQPSYDKQYVRDWLSSAESGWDPASSDPPPLLPPDVVGQTRAKYIEAYERITGRRL